MNTSELGDQYLLENTDANPEFLELNWNLITDLQGIFRFAEIPMIHRSTDYEHSQRVDSLALKLASYIQIAHRIHLDRGKLARFPLLHDVEEIILGDTPGDAKAAWTTQEKKAYHSKSREAVVELAPRYVPERYIPLFISDWEELSQKESNEAQILDIADKWDGAGEVISDIRSGNDTPEIYQAYINYCTKKILPLDRYPMMRLLKQNPIFGLTSIPTLEEVKAMSKIDLDLLSDDDKGFAFWQQVMDPSLPNFYKYWLYLCTNPNSFDLGVFSRYNDVLRQFPLTLEMRNKLIFSSISNEPTPDKGG